MKYLKLVTTAIVLVLSSTTHAALINNGIYTTDTLSGLDWLDLTETSPFSYNYVSSQLGSGGAFEGWSYATASQTKDLFIEFGLPIAWYTTGPNPSTIAPLTNMVNHLGNTLIAHPSGSDFAYGTLGLVTDSTVANTHLRFGAFTYSYGANLSYQTDSTYYEADASNLQFTGHYLIRPSAVPVPAAVWLFGSGLVGLIGVARRKKA